jgi:hypothetical protein
MDKTKEYIKIDNDTVRQFSQDFLAKSTANPFYGKNVFFTQGLRADKHIEFQILGNLGAWASDTEFSGETDYYIIADNLLRDLLINKMDEQLQVLEKEINAKGKRHDKLKIISESAMLKYVTELCEAVNDTVTLDLVKRVPKMDMVH